MERYCGQVKVLRVLLLAACIITLVTTATGCGQSYHSKLSASVSQYRFSVVSWEFGNFTAPKPPPGDAATVLRYFALAGQQQDLEDDIQDIEAGMETGDTDALRQRLSQVTSNKESLRATTEVVLTQQVNDILLSLGILRLPPVSFRITDPPHLLATSPLDRIELQDQVLLVTEMSTAQTEALELKVDGLGVSSLVVELGGFGATYPTTVSDADGMRYTIETAIHEWLHQYLAFRPLGFRYVLDGLGIVKNDDIVTLNETVADLTGKELASRLISTYYPQMAQPAPAPPPTTGFDFDQTMKDIRRTVDSLLAQGKTAEAATYMEQQREFLLTKGYYIRKLNQAYFAFNGIYADSPTSIDPLGDQVRELRNRSGSLKDFLAAVSVMTARQDVVNAIR